MKKNMFFILALLVSNFISGQVNNAAHGGAAGIYIYTAFEPCSPSRPNAEGGVKVKVERRKQGSDAWEQVGFLQTPESAGELTRAYHNMYKYTLAKELSSPDIVVPLWEQYKKTQRWDSLGNFLNERAAGLAMGYLYLDTTAVKNTAYEYQLTELGKSGNSISSKTSNAASYPDASSFTSKPVAVKIEGNNYEAKVDWRMTATKRPTFFKVYKRLGSSGNFEITENQFNVSRNPRNDSTMLSFTDKAIGENQVYFYYAIAVDAYGNTSLASDTAVVKTYNTIDILLPQFFTIRSVSEKRGLQLSWKIMAEQSVAAIEIFRGEKYDGQYTSIGFASGKDTSYFDMGVKPATVYYYYLQITDRFQHKSQRSVRAYGLLEDLQQPRAPRNVNAVLDGSKVKVTWTTADKNIAGYYVFRSIGLDTNYRMISGFITAKDSLSTFVDADNNFSSPYGYSYVVVQENTSHVQSKFSQPFYFKSAMKADNIPVLMHVEAQNTNGLARLYWESLQGISGVTGYNVLRRNNRGVGEFIKLNKFNISSSSNYYTDSTVQMGNVYEYEVQTIVISGKTSTPSNAVIFDLSNPAPMAPAAFTLAAAETGVELNWDIAHSKIVKEVNIYRAERGTKDAIKLGSVKPEVSSYKDLIAEKGKSYFYYLTAIGLDGKESDKSVAKFITIE